MDFDFTTEQLLLRDSARGFLANAHGEKVTTRSSKAKRWHDIAGMGWLAMPFAESDGGLGGGPIETMILMQEIGRANVVCPFVSNAVLAGEILRRDGCSSERLARLAKLMSGETTWAVAYSEPKSRYALHYVEATAVSSNRGWHLNGEKSVVIDGDSADQLIVAARTKGNSREPHGISLFVVPADAEGVRRNAFPLVDGGSGANITFSDVSVPQSAGLGSKHDAVPLLDAAIDLATAALPSSSPAPRQYAR